jgi:TPR repeat protein
VQDDAEAARLYRLAVDQGHAGAQFSLGLMFFDGRGPEASGEIDFDERLRESVRLFRLAAAQGHAAAQYRLGSAFEHGEGVAQDQSEAVRWYRLAALHGSASAQEEMGTAFEARFGRTSIAKDPAEATAEAIRWYRLAEAQNTPCVTTRLNELEPTPSVEESDEY